MKELRALNIIKIAVFTALLIPLLILFPSVNASAAEADPFSVISSFASANGKNVLAVSADAIPGTYSTITEAAYYAGDGDIIYIYPGEYEESLDLRAKNLILFGQDRDTCIIKYETSRYTSPVLNASAGTFSNLTFYGYMISSSELSSDVTGMTPETVDDNFSGYVIHIDDDNEYGRSLVFNNCNIISENNNCVGLGFRDHFSVSFENCLLRSVGNAGILYVHDPEELIGPKSDMKLAFRNCIWENFGYPYVICAKSIHTTNRVELTFQNVTTYCYASNLTELYSPGNAFSGFDVRLQLQLPQVFANTPITLRADKKVSEYLKEFRGQTLSMKPGICFLTEKRKNEKAPDELPKIVTVYYINNAYDLPGDGWIGSNAFYLTEECSGNTLDEMNYHINN
ncbi:MAG: hypothetical protein J6W85_02315 [Lachnospiraceae bacterium]|nr:hypothetical protein [Lachnospiraceae bacterium]